VVVGADTLEEVVQFTVADDGPGIPLQQQERIFDALGGRGVGAAPASGWRSPARS
jgi:K+-sensing histidine kinase KdpD